jgi:hypothetical protein
MRTARPSRAPHARTLTAYEWPQGPCGHNESRPEQNHLRAVHHIRKPAARRPGSAICAVVSRE